MKRSNFFLSSLDYSQVETIVHLWLNSLIFSCDEEIARTKYGILMCDNYSR